MGLRAIYNSKLLANIFLEFQIHLLSSKSLLFPFDRHQMTSKPKRRQAFLRIEDFTQQLKNDLHLIAFLQTELLYICNPGSCHQANFNGSLLSESQCYW